MNISKDRETAHSWRATDRVQGPYGLKQHREPRHFKSLCMALVPKSEMRPKRDLTGRIWGHNVTSEWRQ